MTSWSTEEKRQLVDVLASDADSPNVDELSQYVENEAAHPDLQRRFYIVAETDGFIAGFVRIWYSPHIEEWLNDGIVVLPTYRHRGIGTLLLKAGLAAAADRGAPSVIAHLRNWNVASIKLHEHMGFERETSSYRNSYGDPRPSGGWQYRYILKSAPAEIR